MKKLSAIIKQSQSCFKAMFNHLPQLLLPVCFTLVRPQLVLGRRVYSAALVA
jgi:hypothetical protein